MTAEHIQAAGLYIIIPMCITVAWGLLLEAITKYKTTPCKTTHN